MKALPFFIFICLTFLLYQFLFLSAKAKNSDSVTVGVTISEHLTYVKNNQKIFISTNYKSGLILKNSKDQIITRVFQPNQQEIEYLSTDFFLLVNF